MSDFTKLNFKFKLTIDMKINVSLLEIDHALLILQPLQMGKLFSPSTWINDSNNNVMWSFMIVIMIIYSIVANCPIVQRYREPSTDSNI